VGVSGGGQDADMAKNLLQFKQIYPGLQHMGGIAVTHAGSGMRFFFMPSC
jgi:hypothetical protein